MFFTKEIDPFLEISLPILIHISGAQDGKSGARHSRDGKHSRDGNSGASIGIGIQEVRLYINCFYRVIVCIFSVYLFFFLFLSGFLGIPTAIAIMQIHIIRYLFIPLSTDKGDTSVLKKF